MHAIWKDGRIVPSEPVDWPDGTSLSVVPIEDEDDLLGNTPEAIARWLAAYDALPPLQMSEAEEARWREDRRRMRDHSVAKMQARPIGDRP